MPNTTVRAAAEGMPSINRRAMFAGTAAMAAILAASAVPAEPAEHPDVDLFALDKEMEAAHERMTQAGEVCSEICDRTGGDIVPESEAAEEVFSARVDDLWEIGRRIFASPANTFEGLAVKLRAGDRLLLEDFADENEAVVSIAADINRLAQESVS